VYRCLSAELLFDDNNWWSAKNVSAVENGCVVKVSGLVSGADLNDVGVTRYGDIPIYVIIDFNKLIIGSASVSSSDYTPTSTIEVTGQPDAVYGFVIAGDGTQNGVVEREEQLKSGSLKLEFTPDKSSSGRGVRAFQYFTEKFCSGSKRAF
jgi:hypothetical protein